MGQLFSSNKSRATSCTSQIQNRQDITTYPVCKITSTELKPKLPASSFSDSSSGNFSYTSRTVIRTQQTKNLDLSNKILNDCDIKKLAMSIYKDNAAIKSLNLSNNNISDRGADWLAWALADNVHITSINLSSNNISELGGKKLKQLLEKNHAILELDLSYNNVPSSMANQKIKINLGGYKIVSSTAILSTTYTQPSVQTATKESKPKTAASSSSSFGTFVSPLEHAVYSSNSSAIPTTKHDTSKKITPMFDSIYKASAIGNFNKEYKTGSEVSVNGEMEVSHSVQRKMYGYYECDCGAWWESAHSWANETQDCKGCGNKVFPYDQEDLKPREPIDLDETRLNKPHREDLCGMCKKLGMSCTIFMEIAKPSINKPKSSYYANQKPDVRVKGLPNDITEEKIRKMFASYGDISRVHILKQDPRFSTRVAFITFDDPEAVVDQFNSVKQAPPKAHRRRLLT